MAWYQHDGEYPFVDWSTITVESDVYPDKLWKQTDGDYPFKP